MAVSIAHHDKHLSKFTILLQLSIIRWGASGWWARSLIQRRSLLIFVYPLTFPFVIDTLTHRKLELNRKTVGVRSCRRCIILPLWIKSSKQIPNLFLQTIILPLCAQVRCNFLSIPIFYPVTLIIGIQSDQLWFSDDSMRGMFTESLRQV